MMKEYLPIVGYLLITIVNGYWTWQSLKIRNRDEVIKALREQLDLKEMAVQEMIRSKNELKLQYQHMLAENRELKGENATYKKFHGHHAA